MRTFTPLAFAAFTAGLEAAMRPGQQRALERAGNLVRDEVQRVLGTHEYGWPPLAQRTIDNKGHDLPGVETYEMRDTVGVSANHEECRVGSDMDRAVFFELGTVNQPPRPLFAEALRRKTTEIVDMIGGHARTNLIT